MKIIVDTFYLLPHFNFLLLHKLAFEQNIYSCYQLCDIRAGLYVTVCNKIRYLQSNLTKIPSSDSEYYKTDKCLAIIIHLEEAQHLELPTTNLSQRSGDSEQRHLSRVEEDSVEASSVKTQILQLGEVEVFIHFFLLVSITLY